MCAFCFLPWENGERVVKGEKGEGSEKGEGREERRENEWKQTATTASKEEKGNSYGKKIHLVKKIFRKVDKSFIIFRWTLNQV